jgi:hypothetical protein
VDELLESRQDEVWAAEEEEEEEEEEEHQKELVDATNLATPTGNTTSDVQDGKQLSLVDQVLAMILGALPVVPDQSLQEHYHLRQEHETIVAGWRAYFGRLPH